MNDDLKERCDVLRTEINEINMIMGKRMKDKCPLDGIIEELARKVKCKEIKLSDLEVKLL